MPVYFMQPVGGGPVKIGSTTDVVRRQAELETYYSREMVLLGTIPGGADEEKEVHARFDRLRLGRTEQFKPALELMQFIGQPLLVDPNPDAVVAMKSLKTIAIKGSAEWVAWLESAARFRRTDVAKLIDEAATWYAKRMGFAVPPPSRLP